MYFLIKNKFSNPRYSIYHKMERIQCFVNSFKIRKIYILKIEMEFLF